MYRFPRTLLINVPDYNDKRSPEPLGLGYLASFLRSRGFACDILNATSSGSKRPSFSEITRLASKKRYDLIGMTVFMHLFHETMELAGQIKKRSPGAGIVLGGHHVTFTHKKVLEKYPSIDFVVRGEGERTLLGLVRSLKNGREPASVPGLTYRTENGIRANHSRPLIKDLDTLPFPLREKDRYQRQPKRWRAASIVSSRGCTGNCSYCSISAFYNSQPGASYRTRSAANIVKEIEYLVRKFGVRQIAFKDDNMFVDAKRLMEITDALIAKGISLKFNLIARPDDIVRNERCIPVLKQRGVASVEVGIDAASGNILRRFSKGVDPATNRKAMEILQKNDMFTLVDFIMFEPDMTLKDFRENIDYIKDLGITPFMHGSFVHGSVLHRMYLNPGTAYYERMRRGGRLKKDIFSPEWDFKHDDMNRVYTFIRAYVKTLRKEIVPLKRLRRERLIELNIRKRKNGAPDDRLQRGLLKHAEYELDRVYLELLDKTLIMGERFGFSPAGFSRVRRSMTMRLREIRDRINA